MTIMTSLGHPTNNIAYFDKSLNRKRFCCVKVVNCNSWAEFLSARLHPGLVEFSNAGLESLSWYFRCFKIHSGLEVARQKHLVVGWSSEFVQITSICTRNSCKTLAPHRCRAWTVQSGFCSWSFALQYLCFCWTGQFLCWWRCGCCTRWRGTETELGCASDCPPSIKAFVEPKPLNTIWRILSQLPWIFFPWAFIMFSHHHV